MSAPTRYEKQTIATLIIGILLGIALTVAWNVALNGGWQ